MEEKTFSGITTFLPTPFDSDGGVDLFAYARMLEMQAAVKNNVAVGGALGERPALRARERLLLLSEALGRRDGGRTFFCLSPAEGEKAIELAAECAELGADGLVVEAQDAPTGGLYRFLRKIRDESRLPLLVCRGEGRASLALFGELCASDGVEAIAECGEKPAEWAALSEIHAARGRAKSGMPYTVCGRDDLAFLGEICGAQGVLSGLSALFPQRIFAAWRKKGQARTDGFLPFVPLCPLFSSPDAPARIKWALHRKGICLPDVRLPLCEPDEEVRARIERAVFQTPKSSSL